MYLQIKKFCTFNCCNCNFFLQQFKYFAADDAEIQIQETVLNNTFKLTDQKEEDLCLKSGRSMFKTWKIFLIERLYLNIQFLDIYTNSFVWERKTLK